MATVVKFTSAGGGGVAGGVDWAVAGSLLDLCFDSTSIRSAPCTGRSE